ncbi:MAG: TolB family protein [Pirellulaceae bacterium]
MHIFFVDARTFTIGLACLILAPAMTHAGDETISPLGDFTSQTDVGEPALKGTAVYDAERQSYTLSGGGKNMWFDKDEFHFVYTRIKGDFILQARAGFVKEGVNAHRKLGWMVRASLDAKSPHVNAVAHGDGLTSLQFRRTAGAMTEEIRSELTGVDVIQLERRGRRYTMSVARLGQPFVVSHCDDFELADELYVGLFVCSHDPDVMEQAVFRDVRITIPAAEKFVPYRDYLGSRLEILDVDTGDRRVVFRSADPIEAPNWTPDGTTLIYNAKGKLFRFSLADRTPVPLDTGFANRCNNDHVLSVDGQSLGISHHLQEAGGQSVIYTLPAAGGEPKRVSANAPSYLHGWSPDGRYLIYTGQRGGEFDIYRTPVEGGDELRLTTAKGLDDGSEYSPDGKYIYFNSSRTGTMQVWRMKPDGTGQEQLTHDELNDWFPHVSPDGQRIVFLSFSNDVPADEHPFYKHVYLRMMPIDGGEPRVIAYVYGGQGTINVPSWSPDNRHLAFVSNTGQWSVKP